MSAMITGLTWNAGEMDVTFEVDLNAAAAVIAQRGDDVTTTKTGTGTYSSVLKGTKGLKLFEMLGNGPNIRAAAINGNVQTVQITSIVQGGGTNGDDITVLWTCKTNVPAAADTTSAITVGIWFAFRAIRMSGPLG